MIETIAFAIAVLGAVLLLILFARIRAVDAELKLKKHRSKDAGLADLLNYAAVVDDGVIVCKNGSFMASWLYKGDDNASSTDEQREMVSFRICSGPITSPPRPDYIGLSGTTFVENIRALRPTLSENEPTLRENSLITSARTHIN